MFIRSISFCWVELEIKVCVLNVLRCNPASFSSCFFFSYPDFVFNFSKVNLDCKNDVLDVLALVILLYIISKCSEKVDRDFFKLTKCSKKQFAI